VSNQDVSRFVSARCRSAHPRVEAAFTGHTLHRFNVRIRSHASDAKRAFIELKEAVTKLIEYSKLSSTLFLIDWM